MPRFDPIYTNFSSGEFSPLLIGRVDIEKYGSGCEVMENYMVKPHGPAIRRGGTRFIAEGKQWFRLIPFDTGAQTGLYHLEFGENYIRFYTQGGRLENPPGTPYEIVTTYTEEELYDIWYFGDANSLYLFHVNHAPAILVRSDTYDWVLSDILFTAQPVDWVVGNFPSTGIFHEQRLWLAGTPGEPGAIWGSKVGDFYNLTIGTNPDDAFKYTVYANRSNLIEWFDSGDILMVGSRHTTYKVVSTQFDETITPTNVRVVPQAPHGAASLQPAKIGNKIVYVQKGLLKVRGLAFNLESDSYRAQDLTFLSEHITQPSIIETEYQNEPDSIAMYVRKDGQLIGMSYEPEFELMGWFRIVTDGVIRTISVTDGYSDERYDDVYLGVERVIDGQTKYYIEKLEPPLKPEEDIEDAFYVDSGLSYSGVPISIVAGLDHLEGKTVSVLTDGSVHPDRVVSGGSITLQYEASKIHVGLPSEARLKTMRIEGGNPIGTSQGKTKRLNRVVVRVHRTVGLVVNGERYFMGPPDMNKAVPLFTGDLEVPLDGGYESEGQIEIVQDQPLPSTITAIMPEGRTQ